MFNRRGFKDYLEQNFNGFDNSFLRETISKIIDYGENHCNNSLDQLCWFLTDTIAEIEFGEVVLFMDDSSLTEQGRDEKRDMQRKLKRMGQKYEY